MACCCKSDKSDRMAVTCLGRCDLPKHRCLDKEDIGPGPIPSYMGWLYTAKDSPDHQLRCGWRPGHISCPVLRRMERYCSSTRCGECWACNGCSRSPCVNPCYPLPKCAPARCAPARCIPICAPRCVPRKCSPKKCVLYRCLPPPRCSPSRCSPSRCLPPCYTPSACLAPCKIPPCTKPMLRIIRHNGQYSIITKPDNITNHPSGPYPLKYVINTDDDTCSPDKKAKFSIEAKYNDYHFDYTNSESSFVLDFSPPDGKCYKPCSRKSSVCFPCQ